MGRPSIYLDECVPVSLSTRLSELGYQSTTARDHGLLGELDEYHLRFAADHNLTVLTHNVRDFGRLHDEYRIAGREHAGIILLPQSRSLRLTAVRSKLFLAWISERSSQTGELYRWNDFQQLLIHREWRSDYDEGTIRFALGG